METDEVISELLGSIGMLLAWGILCQLAIFHEPVEEWFHKIIRKIKNKFK